MPVSSHPRDSDALSPPYARILATINIANEPRMRSTRFYACVRVARRGRGVVWNRGKSRSHIRFRALTFDGNLTKTREKTPMPACEGLLCVGRGPSDRSGSGTCTTFATIFRNFTHFPSPSITYKVCLHRVNTEIFHRKHRCTILIFIANDSSYFSPAWRHTYLKIENVPIFTN